LYHLYATQELQPTIDPIAHGALRLPFGGTVMPKFNLSISGTCIAMAVALAVWEVFFFGGEGSFAVFVSS
jgi:hypothetical protein